jgi:hypothetical protein
MIYQYRTLTSPLQRRNSKEVYSITWGKKQTCTRTSCSLETAADDPPKLEQKTRQQRTSKGKKRQARQQFTRELEDRFDEDCCKKVCCCTVLSPPLTRSKGLFYIFTCFPWELCVPCDTSFPRVKLHV